MHSITPQLKLYLYSHVHHCVTQAPSKLIIENCILTKSFSHSAITLQRIVDLSNLLSEKKQRLHSKRFASANVLQPVHMLIMGSITSLISYQHSIYFR